MLDRNTAPRKRPSTRFSGKKRSLRGRKMKREYCWLLVSKKKRRIKMIGTSCWAKSSACLWSIFRIQPCKPDPRNTIGSPKNLGEPWSPDARKQQKIQKPTKKIPRKIRVYLISSTSSRRFNRRKPRVAMSCSPTQVACRFHRLNCGLEGFVIAWIFFNFHITWFQTYV